MNRLFLLYFPGYYDSDLLIGIYDNISKLKDAFFRVIKDEEHEYEFYLSNANRKLTIAEFDRDTEKFAEIEPEALWAELDKKDNVYGKGPYFLLVTAEGWNHDADEWLGIYTTKKEAREAYDRAIVWWEGEQKKSIYNIEQKVVMVEYIYEEDRFRVVDRKELG
jgi:hypothetical protein